MASFEVGWMERSGRKKGRDGLGREYCRADGNSFSCVLTSVGSRDCSCGVYAFALFDCVLG